MLATSEVTCREPLYCGADLWQTITSITERTSAAVFTRLSMEQLMKWPLARSRVLFGKSRLFPPIICLSAVSNQSAHCDL